MVILVACDGRLLLHHRDARPDILHPGCWAGFGGAVEPGEEPQDAARRELREETGLAIRDLTFLCETEDVEGRGDAVSLFYARGPFQPEDVRLTEGQGVALVTIEDLHGLALPPFFRRALYRHLLPRLAHGGE
jgi:8-oxo-dGTP pyrophosphatase MutT (NUDIX family)